MELIPLYILEKEEYVTFGSKVCLETVKDFFIWVVGYELNSHRVGLQAKWFLWKIAVQFVFFPTIFAKRAVLVVDLNVIVAAFLVILQIELRKIKVYVIASWNIRYL